MQNPLFLGLTTKVLPYTCTTFFAFLVIFYSIWGQLESDLYLFHIGKGFLRGIQHVSGLCSSVNCAASLKR